MSHAPSPPPGGVSLADLPKGGTATIVTLREDARRASHEHIRRLMELGFLPGEQIRIVAKGFPSGDPIAVRIGTATFALRRFEAELIGVLPDEGDRA